MTTNSWLPVIITTTLPHVLMFRGGGRGTEEFVLNCRECFDSSIWRRKTLSWVRGPFWQSHSPYFWSLKPYMPPPPPSSSLSHLHSSASFYLFSLCCPFLHFPFLHFTFLLIDLSDNQVALRRSTSFISLLYFIGGESLSNLSRSWRRRRFPNDITDGTNRPPMAAPHRHRQPQIWGQRRWCHSLTISVRTGNSLRVNILLEIQKRSSLWDSAIFETLKPPFPNQFHIKPCSSHRSFFINSTRRVTLVPFVSRRAIQVARCINFCSK